MLMSQPLTLTANVSVTFGQNAPLRHISAVMAHNTASHLPSRSLCDWIWSFLHNRHFSLAGPGWILPVRQRSRRCVSAVMVNDGCDSEFKNVLMTPLETMLPLNLEEVKMQFPFPNLPECLSGGFRVTLYWAQSLCL